MLTKPNQRGNRRYFGVSFLTIVGLIIFAVYWDEHQKRSEVEFSFYFDVQYPESSAEKARLAPIVLEKLKEVENVLNIRTGKGDDQLLPTFKKICDLARNNGFTPEADTANCPP
ncbi:MAG: hypothetical protein AAB453_03445 [Patescibacteria group bacterium]